MKREADRAIEERNKAEKELKELREQLKMKIVKDI